MSRKIIFSDDAIETLLSTTNFIESKWNSRLAEKFLEKVYKTLTLAAENPICLKLLVLVRISGLA